LRDCNKLQPHFIKESGRYDRVGSIPISSTSLRFETRSFGSAGH
jgi:hypothetical protein